MGEWNRNKDRNAEIRRLRSIGLSIPEISKRLNCSKSTVSLHCKPIKLKKQQKLNLAKRSASTSSYATECSRMSWVEKRTKAINEAIKEWPNVKSDPKEMAFLAFYWGEGTRKGDSIGFVNTDPGAVKFAYDYLLQHVQRIAVNVRYYPEQDPRECKAYWEKLLDCEATLRPKTWLGKKRKITSRYGICYLQGSNWAFKLKILTLIDCWRQELLGCETKLDPNKRLGSQW